MCDGHTVLSFITKTNIYCHLCVTLNLYWLYFSLCLLCCLPDLTCPMATCLHGQIQQAGSGGKFMQKVASSEHRKQDSILYTAQIYRDNIKGGVTSRHPKINEQLCCRCLPFPYLHLWCCWDLFYLVQSVSPTPPQPSTYCRCRAETMFLFIVNNTLSYMSVAQK